MAFETHCLQKSIDCHCKLISKENVRVAVQILSGYFQQQIPATSVHRVATHGMLVNFCAVLCGCCAGTGRTTSDIYNRDFLSFAKRNQYRTRILTTLNHAELNLCNEPFSIELISCQSLGRPLQLLVTIFNND